MIASKPLFAKLSLRNERFSFWFSVILTSLNSRQSEMIEKSLYLFELGPVAGVSKHVSYIECNPEREREYNLVRM